MDTNCSVIFLIISTILCFVSSAPVPEPWYGDLIGSLQDDQDAGIKGDVYVVNKSCIQIVAFSYNAKAPDLYFWADKSDTLSPTGVRIPTFEFGDKPLGVYESSRVVLILPHDHKISDFKSLGLYCQAFTKSFGQVTLPQGSLPPKHTFLNGTLRGRKYKVGSGPILVLDRRTIKVYGFTFDGESAPDGYFFVGTGPEPQANKGVKVPIRGRDTADLLKLWWPDTHHQVIVDKTHAMRSLTKTVCAQAVRYKMWPLVALLWLLYSLLALFLPIPLDVVRPAAEKKEILRLSVNYLIAYLAVTAMNEKYMGGKDLILELPESHDIYNIDWLSVYCYQFRVDFGHVLLGNVSDRIPPYVPPQKRYDDASPSAKQPQWPVITLPGSSHRTNFTFQLGPPGGRRAFESWAGARPNEYVWYVNGYMTPELVLKRGVAYTFNVEAGDDPSTEHFYNPLYFSDEPFGGYMKLPPDDREKVTVFAGLDEQRMPIKNSAGRLCLWSQKYAEENADKHDDFESYRKALKLKCSPGRIGTFIWTPDNQTPESVFYQSYTGYNMGFKVRVVDEIPEDIEDFTEQPYQYEILIQHNGAKKVPRKWQNLSPSLVQSWTLVGTLLAVSVLLR